MAYGSGGEGVARVVRMRRVRIVRRVVVEKGGMLTGFWVGRERGFEGSGVVNNKECSGWSGCSVCLLSSSERSSCC